MYNRQYIVFSDGLSRQSTTYRFSIHQQPPGVPPLTHQDDITDVLTGDATIAETSDGTILFVFGDEAAAAAHQKEATPEPEPQPEQAPEPEPEAEAPAQPESKPAEPVEAAASPPAESPAAPEEAEPEAAFEEARGVKVIEAVKEKPMKEGAETSGMHCPRP